MRGTRPDHCRIQIYLKGHAFPPSVSIVVVVILHDVFQRPNILIFELGEVDADLVYDQGLLQWEQRKILLCGNHAARDQLHHF
jgi:hypothetical protein